MHSSVVHSTASWEGLTNHGITQEPWDAMGRAERNQVNHDLRARVVEAEAGAVGRLGEILEPL